ncbi:MAG: tail sheath protein [Segetibacter sp.]|jgi:phage tail sheath protein FI|nr:tail sheath protein [Segetibacter sp.]
MPVLKLSTPGVYVQEIPSLPPSVAEVETAIPAFIGYTEKADQFVAGDLKMVPNKINSLGEYITFYGGAAVEINDSINVTLKNLGSNQYDVLFSLDAAKLSKHNLYYSIKHFYDNGGGTAFIVSVDNYTHAAGVVSKDDLKAGLTAVYDVDEVTLLCIPEANKNDSGGYKEVVQAMITQAYELKDRFAIIDPFKVTPKNSADPNGDIDADVLTIRNSALGVDENKFAAAYYPNIVTSYNYRFNSDVEPKNNIDLLKIDAYTWAGAGVDPAPTAVGTVVGTLKGSVIYNKIDSEIKKQYVVLPPSPAMVGLYTRVDLNKGVWKAPANEALLSVIGPDLAVSSREQESLNVDSASGKSINVIRTFPGFGTLVWGARTLNGNDNEWRYISVRRFFNMVEESIKKSSQWAVFEPNTAGTWVKMQAMIENYLYLKWREGALAGVKPEQAFYVKVGLGTTMTSLDILEGRLNIEIGLAVARPAEFIVLKFTQLLQQS